MLKSMLNIILGRTVAREQLTGKVNFDLVVKFVDSTKDDLTQSFAAESERDSRLEELLTSAEVIKIASITYENVLVFWRRFSEEDSLPSKVPQLEGDGDLVMRFIGGTGDMLLETVGYALKKVKNSLLADASRFGPIQEISVLRRTVACERMSVLVRRGQAPASARSLDSDEDE